MNERYIEVTIHRPGHAARQARRERKERCKRRVCGVLAALSAMLMLGTVGGVEQNMMELGTGALYMALTLAATVLFTWMAGGFDYEE